MEGTEVIVNVPLTDVVVVAATMTDWPVPYPCAAEVVMVTTLDVKATLLMVAVVMVAVASRCWP